MVVTLQYSMGSWVEGDMSTGKDGWHASWKRGEVTLLFDQAFLPVAKWPDKPEIKAHYTKLVEPFGDCWRQSSAKDGCDAPKTVTADAETI